MGFYKKMYMGALLVITGAHLKHVLLRSGHCHLWKINLQVLPQHLQLTGAPPLNVMCY